MQKANRLIAGSWYSTAGIDLAARVGAAGDLLDGDAAVGRDEHVVDRDILAAGAGQADHVPGVDDRVVAGRQQEDAGLA